MELVTILLSLGILHLEMYFFEERLKFTILFFFLKVYKRITCFSCCIPFLEVDLAAELRLSNQTTPCNLLNAQKTYNKGGVFSLINLS